MLLRPPFIKEQDVKSQSSNQISHYQKQSSVKSSSKNKKKENSLGMKRNNISKGQSNLQSQSNKNNQNYDSDNGSVHSVNSRRSKGKTKESTIAIGKKQSGYQNINYSIQKDDKKQEEQYEIFKLQSDEDDNRSVGSHASRNSRKNTKKQNSLGRNNAISNRNKIQLGSNKTNTSISNMNNKPNIQLGYYFNNNQNTKNNNNVFKNYNNENRNQSNNAADNKEKEKYYMQQYSKVETIQLDQPQSANNNIFNPKSYTSTNQTNNNRNKVQKPFPTSNQNKSEKPHQSHSPFQQITLKRQSEEEDQPIYLLKQDQMTKNNQGTKNLFAPNYNNKNTNQINKNYYEEDKAKQNINLLYANPVKQINQKLPSKQFNIQSENNKIKVQLQQSHTIQPQLISTKTVASKSTRRNRIFDNENNSISNSSNVLTSRTNMEGSFQRSRSKSKSKLGGLLKQSRQKRQAESKEKEKPEKRIFEQNQLYKNQEAKKNTFNFNQSLETDKNFVNIEKSNLVSISTLHEQSRVGGQKLQQNHKKLQQIQRKKVQNQMFDLGQSQSDLNLSMSHKVQEGIGLRGDSLHFNFQPQKKKGISITTKQKEKSEHGRSIESKKHLDRLMKKCQQNEEFLAKSILSSNSQLRQSKRSNLQGPSPKLNKQQGNTNNKQVASVVNNASNRPFEMINQHENEQQPAWYNIIKNDQDFKGAKKKEELKIKQVERKEIRRPSEEQIKLQKPQQQIKIKQSPLNQQIKLKKGQNLPQSNFNKIQTNEKQIIITQENSNQQINKKINSRQQKDFFNNEQILNKNYPQQKDKVKQHKNSINNVTLQQKNINHRKNQNKNNFYTYQQQKKNINQNRQSPIYKPLKSQAKNNTNFIEQPFMPKSKQTSQNISKIQSSAISHDLSLSQNGSQRSNSQKKIKKKQSSLNIMKKHKVQVRDQSPRAQQSFYQLPQEEQTKLKENSLYKQKKLENQTVQYKNFKSQNVNQKLQSSRSKVQYKKPNLINFNQSDSQQQQVKSKTDMNFYNYGDSSQRSMRPPSSKPPLSRKSGCSSSKSKSKTKENTLNINVNKKENKLNKNASNLQKQNQSKPKKKTLLDLAQDKSYQGSGYDQSNSQCSFNSRQSFGSVNSRGSRKSSNSKKQSTLPITIKSKTSQLNNNFARPQLHKIESTNSQIQVFDHSIYNKLQTQSQKKSSIKKQKQLQEIFKQRTIVSKDTYFIDEKGRLVKQDLVIQGSNVYGRPTQKSAQQMAYQRMRRSRQNHRSRSKSRDGSSSRLSRKNSKTNLQSSGYESAASSSNYFPNMEGMNSNYGNQRQNLYIQEFIKPVQQPYPINNQHNNSNKYQKSSYTKQYKIEQQFYENEQPYESYYRQQEEQQPVRNITLNELFGRNNNNNNSKKPANKFINEGSKYGQKSNYNNNNNYNNKGGQSMMGSSSVRKKSLSRTEKTFYNR